MKKQAVQVLKSESAGAKFPSRAATRVDGKRSLHRNVLFLGDSIIASGHCLYYLQLLENLRHPGSGVRFYNGGRSGSTARECVSWLSEELERVRPDRVFIMFGMNDIGWMDYDRELEMGAARRRAADQALASCRAGWRELVERLVSSGITELTLVTPTPYDEYSETARAVRRRHVNEYGLASVSEFLRGLSAERGFGLLDLHADMTTLCREHPDAALCGHDRVHPGRLGHLYMATRFWRAMDEGAPVAETRVSFQGAVAKADRAEVSSIQVGADVVSFDHKPGALPIPDLREWRDLCALAPDVRKFNREILAVAGLPAGDWILLADGVYLGKYTAEDFAAGVNLAELATPNRNRAARAAEFMDDLHDFDLPSRDLACAKACAKARLGKLGFDQDALYDRLASVRPVACRLEVRRAESPVDLATPAEALWSGRKAHPAVVNPVVGWDSENMISLRGDWDFRAGGDGVRRNAFGGIERLVGSFVKFDRKINVPGVWEAQGVGTPGMSNAWDIKADCAPRFIRHVFQGVGFYRRQVPIPAGWKGRRIWLKVGGVTSTGRFYVNGANVAICDDYCGTYKYEITDLVTPGDCAQIDVQVSNRTPSRKGEHCSMHRWGGIVRDVELEATPQCLIDDCWVRGEFDSRRAQVHVDLDGLSPHEKLTVRVVIDDAAVERTVEGVEGALSDLVVSVPLKRFRPWSPEHPNLYTARVDLVSAENRVLQSRFERFGVRKLEVRGKAFYLNDRPFYIRGCGHHNVYPLEGFAPANRELHRRHLALQRAAGFNFSRTHTRCPPPEHFDAADELGILIEAELPYYNDQPTQAFAFDPKRDVTELWRNFRRHPSFAVYSMGNEGTFSPEGDMRLHRYVKAMDPDRLKINQDGGEPSINPPEASDFLGGPIDVWTRGSFDPDRPFVAHEYLNLAVKFDPRREDRYTGVMPSPITRADRRALLAEFGLDEPWGDRLQDAQHALQRHYLKAGLESARLDPHCDGFCFWALTDTGAPQGKTVASVGLFDAFMGVKPNGFTPREMARFNSADCVLADLRPASRILAEGDRFEADVWFAHYSEARTSSAPTRWWLRTTDRVLVEGTLPSSPGDVSAVHLIGNVSFAVPAVGAPCKAEFAVKVGRAENHWDVWLFPRRETRALPDVAVADALSPPLSRLYGDLLGEGGAARAKLVVAPLGSALCADALARGQRVLAIDKTTGVPNIRLGWWWLGPQVGSALVDSPVFGALPHEGHLSPLLFRVVKLGLPLPVEGLLPQDVFMVDEGGKDFRLHLAQATCGKGSVLVCHGLDVLSGTPEGTALLDGLVDYALSDAFSPASEIELPRLGGSLRELNGWSRTVRRAEFLTSDLPSGAGAFEYVQGVEDRNEMSWLTAEVPLEIKDAPTCTFAFWGGMRYWARPEMPVSIFVDGVKAIDIPALVWADAVWRTGDCVLKYTKGMEGDRTGDYGLFELTVPTSLLAPGRPVELKAKAVLNGSGRAFGIIVPE